MKKIKKNSPQFHFYFVPQAWAAWFSGQLMVQHEQRQIKRAQRKAKKSK